MIVVLPAHKRRKRHQYRFSPPLSLETKVRAAIIDQVEFNVASTPEQLKLSLAVGVLLLLPVLRYWKIGGKKSTPNPLNKLKDGFDAAVICGPFVARGSLFVP